MKKACTLDKKGISIIEVIISLALLSFFFPLISDLAFSVDKNYPGELTRFHNLLDARAFMEKTESEVAQNFNLSLEQSSSTQISLIDTAHYTKEINFSSSSAHLTLQTLATDWKNAFGGSSCAISNINQWKNFSISGSIDLGNGNAATAIASRGNFVFLTADAATKTQNDFFVMDVSNKNAPTIVSALDTGPGLTVIKLAGKYAYVGNSSINAQIQVIDISTPSAPILISSFKLPGTYSDATTIPNSLFFYKGRLYVGTKKSQIAEFHILDVSDVHTIRELGSFEMNTQINDIIVREFSSSTLAFIASPDANDLTILDISDPQSIKKIGGFDGPGTSVSGKSLSLSGTTLFLGRSKNSPTPASEVYALDISHPENILTQGTINIGATVNSMISQNGLIFIENQKVGDSFQIWNTATSSTAVRLSDSTATFNSKPVALSCTQNFFYLALSSNDALRIISPLNQ